MGDLSERLLDYLTNRVQSIAADKALCNEVSALSDALTLAAEDRDRYMEKYGYECKARLRLQDRIIELEEPKGRGD